MSSTTPSPESGSQISERPRAFDQVTDDPCPVCMELYRAGRIRGRAVMPLPEHPGRLESSNQPCCTDCQATDTTRRFGNHPDFAAARLTIANERCEGLVMPPGLMEHMGLCMYRMIRPCSNDDLADHRKWLEKHGIEDSTD